MAFWLILICTLRVAATSLLPIGYMAACFSDAGVAAFMDRMYAASPIELILSTMITQSPALVYETN